MFRHAALFFLLLSGPLAAEVHLTNQTTDASGNQIGQQDIYTKNGQLLVVDSGVGGAASGAAAGAPGAAGMIGKMAPKASRNETFYNPQVPELISLEGDGSCRVLDSDTQPPPGMAGAAGQNHADTMATARQQMEQAMAQARQQGMTPEQERMMQQMFGGPDSMMGGPGAQAKPEGSWRATGRTQSFGQFGTAEAYEELDGSGQVTHVYWLAPVSQIPGGQEVRSAMEGMLDFFQRFVDSMGMGQLIDTPALKAIREREGVYPVAVDDVQAGTRDQVIAAQTDDGDVNYQPDCARRIGMFES